MEITIFDLLLTPFYLLLIYSVAGSIQKKNEVKMPLYKWYTKGLIVKLLGAISVCLIYQFYYTGGDTVAYFQTARAICNLIHKDPLVFFDVLFGDNSPMNYSYFDSTTGWPVYWRDEKALFVARWVVPLVFLSFKTFTVTAVLLAWLCYAGIWKLFLLYNQQFPFIQKQLAISVLFIPSVVFWGSGLLKDTITLSAVGWYTYYFFYFFIQKKYRISYLIFIFISAFLLISIKPYILFALLPGSIIWLSNEKLAKVQSKLLKAMAAPVFLSLGVGIGFFVLSQMGDLLGVYSIDKVLDKAVESNLDQKADYYGGQSFDIGDFDASVGGVASKAHLAIAATLFRPYLWDARNPVMLLSALENTYILLLTIFLIVKLKFMGFFRLIGKNPLLLFSVLFSLFFAFSVGIATSNFGSLVRLKIPCIPFYVSSLFVLKYFYDNKINTKRKKGL
ncbi:MAG: hypothetical protein K0S44_1013 [Bacteroidetes bacterium]|jgi:hypothetical protein|nr:hypothetical protein [Bacteroidota bacterium]